METKWKEGLHRDTYICMGMEKRMETTSPGIHIYIYRWEWEKKMETTSPGIYIYICANGKENRNYKTAVLHYEGWFRDYYRD